MRPLDYPLLNGGSQRRHAAHPRSTDVRANGESVLTNEAAHPQGRASARRCYLRVVITLIMAYLVAMSTEISGYCGVPLKCAEAVRLDSAIEANLKELACGG